MQIQKKIEKQKNAYKNVNIIGYKKAYRCGGKNEKTGTKIEQRKRDRKRKKEKLLKDVESKFERA